MNFLSHDTLAGYARTVVELRSRMVEHHRSRYVLDEAAMRTKVSAVLVYAFWRIQAQPLATVAAAPVDRSTRRRAARASIRHDTRVVMLRRTHPLAEPGDATRNGTTTSGSSSAGTGGG
jgi:hypothetical protein